MKNKISIFLGIFFFLFGVLAVANAIYLYDFEAILWFCYISLILIGLGIMFKNSFLIVGQLNIVAIPLVIWVIDFLSKLLLKNSFWGITEYFFEPGPITSKIITLQHLFTLPLVFLAIYLIKKEVEKKNFEKMKLSWIFSFAEITLFFFFLRLFTTFERNINCVFEFCGDIQINFYYPLAWFLIYIAMIALTNFVVVKLFIDGKTKK